MKSITRNSDHQWIGALLIIFCGIAAFWAVLSLAHQTGFSWDVNSSHIDHVGSYFSGLVGIVSIYYLYRTLRSQSLSFRMSSFENRFMEMVSLQREKTKNLSVIDTTSKDTPELHGQKAISLFLSYYNDAYKEVSDYMINKSISSFYSDQDAFRKDSQIWTENLLHQRTCSNIAYLITFIGVKDLGISVLRNKYLSKYNTTDIDVLLKKFRLLLANGDPMNNNNENPVSEDRKLTNNNKQFAGFQQEFGNYFRQLYQIVNHVNSQQWLKYGDKYGYVKMLRSQLSNQEEVLLFYNSLSDVGMAWEYENMGSKKPDANNQLLTKYNLLKNIPHNTTLPKVEDYYAHISYEDSLTNISIRKNLEKKYK